METTRTATPLRLIAETGSLAPSIDGLDLTRLPARLDDSTLARVQAIAAAPLPALPPSDDRHFAKCLRVMLAVLPRQNTDAVGGELFVEAYRRQLGHFSDDAIAYLAERATRECRWFPTIAECLDMLGGWKRCDEATRRRQMARSLAGQERMARERDQRLLENGGPSRAMSQDEIDALPPHMVKLGLAAGFLREVGERVVYKPGDAGADA